MFLGTLFPLPVVALSRSNVAKNNTEIPDSIRHKSLLTPSDQHQPELVIAPGELRLMTEELESLIGRFQMTLLTADANHSPIDISSSNVIEQILEQKTIGRKQHKQIEGQFAKSYYQNSHQALQLARPVQHDVEEPARSLPHTADHIRTHNSSRARHALLRNLASASRLR